MLVQSLSHPSRARGRRKRSPESRPVPRSSARLVALPTVDSSMATVTCSSNDDGSPFVVRCTHCGIVRAYGIEDHAEAIRILVRHRSMHMAGLS
jgi:hypothetical protein